MEIKYVSIDGEKIKLFYQKKKTIKKRSGSVYRAVIRVYNSGKKINEIYFNEYHNFLIPTIPDIKGIFKIIASKKINAEEVIPKLEEISYLS